VRLRQSYVRIAKRAAMMAGRYAHAKQFNRYRRKLRILRIRLGRIIRDIRRKIAGHADLEAAFPGHSRAPIGSDPSSRASAVGSCIPSTLRRWRASKGKASAPYEFGVRASIVTTNARAPGGQFVLHARALPGDLMTVTRWAPSSKPCSFRRTLVLPYRSPQRLYILRPSGFRTGAVRFRCLDR
jgi:transposase, IS5 family